MTLLLLELSVIGGCGKIAAEVMRQRDWFPIVPNKPFYLPELERQAETGLGAVQRVLANLANWGFCDARYEAIRHFTKRIVTTPAFEN